MFSVPAATATGNRIAWEYRVVTATVFQDDLGKAINSSVAEGWEFVSAPGPNEGNLG